MVNLKYPCPENASTLAEVEGGRFCEACSKTLIDFTGMSPSQVQETISANQGGCGVFSKEQVNNRLSNENRSLFRIAFALIFVLGINSNLVFGQECHTAKSANIEIEHVKSELTTVRGTVVDYYGKPIHKAKVKVAIGDTFYTIKTDEKGEFLVEPRICIAEKVEVEFSFKDKFDEKISFDKVGGDYTIRVMLEGEEDQQQFLGFFF